MFSLNRYCSHRQPFPSRLHVADNPSGTPDMACYSLLPPAQHGESPCHMRRAFLTPKDSTGQESRILRKSAPRVFVLLGHSAPPFADHAHHSTNVTWHHLFHVVPQSICLCPPQTFRPIVRRSLSCHMSTCGATETSSTSMSPAGGG